MNIFYSSRFIRQFKKLPKSIQDLAIEKEKVFRKNMFDSLLDTHKLHGKMKEFYSFSVDYKYRIVFEFSNGKKAVCFYSISDHDVYK